MDCLAMEILIAISEIIQDTETPFWHPADLWLVFLLAMRSVAFGMRAALLAVVRHQMHSAFRTVAWLVLPDFRVHGTNIAAHDGCPRPKKR